MNADAAPLAPPIASTDAPPWVVLKFGGTSVASRACWETIGAVAQARLDAGERPVVVCSAVSGISNQLEALITATQTGEHQAQLDAIVARHRALADDLGLSDWEALLAEPLGTLRRLTLGMSLTGEVSPRLHAEIMAQGELMSTRLGAAFFSSQGIPAAWHDARDMLTSDDGPRLTGHRRYLSATCGYAADPALSERLRHDGSGVVLTQGFIARTPQGHTALLGRGGSDTSAAYLAARLGAARCEIWTDVPGMYTANPRQVPNARLLRGLAYDEAQEIASTGAKVLHPRCIAPVRAAQIPLHICCTSRPDIQGTVISRAAPEAGPKVKAISVKTGQVLMSMDTPGMWQQVGFLADVFACFKQHGLSIDLVSTSEMNVTVTLDPASNDLGPANVARLEEALGRLCTVRTVRPCAAVSLVGQRIRAELHKLGPAFKVFEEHSIHLVTQAASDLNLSFVVGEDQAERLVRRLHGLLFQETRPDTTFGPTWEELFAPQSATPAPGDDHHAETASSARVLWWQTRRAELVQLAQDRSPRYVYNGATLDAAVATLRGLSSIDRIFYAIKANPFAPILKRFEAAGLGFECVSPGELRHVLGLFPDIDPKRILFTPNFAPSAEYAEAFEAGVHVTLDNLYPLERWPEVFAGRDVLVRIDPGQGRGHHDYVKTAGARSKFGIGVGELDRLERLTKEANVRVVGLHAHSGSGIFTSDGWSQTAGLLTQLASRFPDVAVIDLGGGLGVPSRPSQPSLDLDALNASLAPIREAHARLEFWIEPGRYLVANAGVLIARATQLKTKGPIDYIGLDAGMNSLIRPALYGAYHGIVNLSRLGAPATVTANIVGPICESGDTLGYARRVPPTEAGDVFLIDTAGAYGHAMSSNYNLRTPAEEHLLD